MNHFLRIGIGIAGMTCALGTQATPAFPTIAQATQQARDGERRDILDAELASEQAALAMLRATNADAPSAEQQATLHRHVENIAALQRELARLGAAPLRLAVRAVAMPAAAPPPAPFWDVYRRGERGATAISTASDKEADH